MEEDLRYTLTFEDSGRTLRELLRQRLLLSSRLLRRLKVQGGVALNGKSARLADRGEAGDVLTVCFPREENIFAPEALAVEIVYEDRDFLIVDKPAGMVVHPTKGFQSGTLANALAWHLAQRGEDYKIRFVNRLDMDTSGLVAVAKNAHAQDFLSREMEKGRVRKVYLALAYGALPREGLIDAPIAKDPAHVARRTVSAQGLPSRTRYRALRVFPAGALPALPENETTLLALWLETGRTHQIRVHLTSIGHPLVGDELYAPVCGFQPPYPIARQALHAGLLCFDAPGGARVRAKAPLPPDFASLIGSEAAEEAERFLGACAEEPEP